MEFPVLHSEKNVLPERTDSVCPVCSKNKVWGNNEYVELSGGFISSAENLEVDLWLDWFSESNGGAQEQEEVAIVSEVKAPRFQLAFCSTDCLRKFLNSAVDKLELKINANKNS